MFLLFCIVDASQLMLQHSSQGDDSDSEYLVEGMYTCKLFEYLFVKYKQQLYKKLYFHI